jgi:hypothetical protein
LVKGENEIGDNIYFSITAGIDKASTFKGKYYNKNES